MAEISKVNASVKTRLVGWLREKVKKSGKKGIVIGISGGVDSSVVAALAAEAVTKKNILCLILPCESSDEDASDAKMFAKSFGFNAKTIDLTPIYRTLIKSLPKGSKMARVNLKPRLRMLTIYYFANNLDYLVAGTGNKSELSIGYFTKYGDGGVDILPLGDLYKSQVRELARLLGIPEKIITKPPTAGLWAGQTDEGEIGMTYDELEYRLRNKKYDAKLKRYTENAKHKLILPEIFKI